MFILRSTRKKHCLRTKHRIFDVNYCETSSTHWPWRVNITTGRKLFIFLECYFWTRFQCYEIQLLFMSVGPSTTTNSASVGQICLKLCTGALHLNPSRKFKIG